MAAVSGNVPLQAMCWRLTGVLANAHNSARQQQPHFSDEGTEAQRDELNA